MFLGVISGWDDTFLVLAVKSLLKTSIVWDEERKLILVITFWNKYLLLGVLSNIVME